MLLTISLVSPFSCPLQRFHTGKLEKQGSVSALVPDGYESHHDYFDAFFASGDYLQFIQPASKGAQQAGDVVKMKKDYKVGLLVQVNLSALRKRLEKDGITKGVRSLFKF